jgi:hypothetical protein
MLTLLEVVTVAVQLFEPLPPAPVAVTVMLSIVLPTAFRGTVTLSVAVLFSPAGIVSEVGATVGPQLGVALSLAVRPKLSELLSVFVTVTV